MKHNWEYKSWDEVLKIFNGKNQAAVENPNGLYPIYGSGGIMSYADAYICPENCTIIGRKGNINNPIFVTSKFWNVDTAFGLCPNEYLLPRFLFYFCQKYDFEKHNKATTIPSLVKNDLLKISMPVPPMEVQEQIVAELDNINGIIEDCRELLRNLDALAQSLFYDYFGDPVTNPKAWPLHKLSNIAPQYQYNGDIPDKNELWLLNLDMIEKGTGRIISHQKVRYEDIGSSVYKICPNQVLYSKLRPNLNKVVIADDYGYCTSELLPLNPIEQLSNCQYFAYLLRTKECVAVFSGKVAGAKMPRVDLKTFREFLIPLPPLALQEEFAGRVEQIEAQKRDVEATIAELQTLLYSRMDYWFIKDFRYA